MRSGIAAAQSPVHGGSMQGLRCFACAAGRARLLMHHRKIGGISLLPLVDTRNVNGYTGVGVGVQVGGGKLAKIVLA